MRTRRFLAVLGAPIFAVACATGSTAVVGSGDGGTGSGGADASYGADDAGSSSGSDGGSTPIDSGGAHGIEGGVTDSGGGGGGSLITPGGDCIGDPGASEGVGYDFQCEFDESFDDDEPCTPDAGTCATNYCCFTNKSSMCYSDYGYQCVEYQ